MARYVSPGAYYVEVDISDYPPAVNSSVVGIVGFASKGPIAGKDGEKATLITSPESLVRIFGKPNEDIAGQGLEGALEILEGTNSMYYVRCAAASAVESSAAVSVGWCPAFAVSTLGMQSAHRPMGVAEPGNLNYKFNVCAWDNSRSKIIDNKTFLVPSSTVTTSALGGKSINALRTVFGGSVDGDRVGVFGTDTSAWIAGTVAGSGSLLRVAAYHTSSQPGETTKWHGSPVLIPLSPSGDSYPVSGQPMRNPTWGRTDGTTSAFTASGGTFTNLNYYTRSLYAGEGYNEGTTVAGDTSGNSVEIDILGGNNVLITTNDEGFGRETFKGGTTSSIFLENVVGKTNADATSDFVIGYFASGSQLSSG